MSCSRLAYLWACQLGAEHPSTQGCPAPTSSFLEKISVCLFGCTQARGKQSEQENGKLSNGQRVNTRKINNVWNKSRQTNRCKGLTYEPRFEVHKTQVGALQCTHKGGEERNTKHTTTTTTTTKINRRKENLKTKTSNLKMTKVMVRCEQRTRCGKTRNQLAEI